MSFITGLLVRWGLKQTLAGKLTPWVAGAAVVAILAALAGLAVTIADRRHENALDVAAKGGATAAVVASQAQTLNQLRDANHAEQTLRSSGERSSPRFDQCLLDNRDKRTCERYRPLAPAE